MKHESIDDNDTNYFKQKLDDSCFLRYYYDKENDTFVLGIKITKTYIHIIVYDSCYKSIKLNPLISGINWFTYNEWNFKMEKLNSIVEKDDEMELAIKHFTTASNLNDIGNLLGNDIFNAYHSFGLFGSSNQQFIESLEKFVKDLSTTTDGLNKLFSLKLDSERLLELKFCNNAKKELELVSITHNDNSNVGKKSTKGTSTESNGKSNRDDLNMNFNTLFSKLNNLPKGFTEYFKPDNFFDIVWFCGDCALLKQNNLGMNVYEDKHSLLSIDNDTDNIRQNVRDVFNVVFFNNTINTEWKVNGTKMLCSSILTNQDYKDIFFKYIGVHMSKEFLFYVESISGYLTNILLNEKDNIEIDNFLQKVYSCSIDTSKKRKLFETDYNTQNKKQQNLSTSSKQKRTPKTNTRSSSKYLRVKETNDDSLLSSKSSNKNIKSDGKMMTKNSSMTNLNHEFNVEKLSSRRWEVNHLLTAEEKKEITKYITKYYVVDQDRPSNNLLKKHNCE